VAQAWWASSSEHTGSRRPPLRLEIGDIDAARFDKVVDPAKMVGGGISDA